jgi:hypothetical protein
MSRRRRIGIIAMAIVLTLVVLFAVIVIEPTQMVSGLLRGDAIFRYRTTSHWREVLRVEGAAGRISPKTRRLFEFEPGAEPVLEQCLADPDPNVRWAAVVLYHRCFPDYQKQVKAYLRLLEDPADQVSAVAARALGALGRESLNATPKLAKMARLDNDRAIPARYALWSIDEEKAIEAEGWMAYASDSWGFSTQFLGAPKQATDTNQFTGLAFYEFESHSGPSLFQVVVAFLPEEILSASTAEQRYESSPQNTANAMSGKVERNEPIEQNGLVGRRQRIVAPDGILESYIFEAGDRVYLAQVAYPIGAVHPRAVDRFLNSFQISWRPRGDEVSAVERPR